MKIMHKDLLEAYDRAIRELDWISEQVDKALIKSRGEIYEARRKALEQQHKTRKNYRAMIQARADDSLRQDITSEATSGKGLGIKNMEIEYSKLLKTENREKTPYEKSLIVKNERAYDL